MDYWLRLTVLGNPQCDVLIVDTPTSTLNPRPLALNPVYGSWFRYDKGMGNQRMIYRFDDNIGHLNNVRGGKDGWGRAFTFGLQAAIDGKYDYVAHIEGDLLFKPSVNSVIKKMRNKGIGVASMSLNGTITLVGERLVETGVMFFSTDYLVKNNFIKRYNWPYRTNRPSPEDVIFTMVDSGLHVLDFAGLRNDKHEVTADNVVHQKLDYITHCKDFTIYDKFMEG